MSLVERCGAILELLDNGLREAGAVRRGTGAPAHRMDPAAFSWTLARQQACQDRPVVVRDSRAPAAGQDRAEQGAERAGSPNVAA